MLHVRVKRTSLFGEGIQVKMFYDIGPSSRRQDDGQRWQNRWHQCLEEVDLKMKVIFNVVSCNRVFHLSNWQKVQSNTDLFLHAQKYLYTDQMTQLKDI